MSALTSLGSLPNSGGTIQIVTPEPAGAGGQALNSNFQSLFDYLAPNAFLPISGGDMTGALNMSGHNLDMNTGAGAGGGTLKLDGGQLQFGSGGTMQDDGSGGFTWQGGGGVNSGGNLNLQGASAFFAGAWIGSDGYGGFIFNTGYGGMTLNGSTGLISFNASAIAISPQASAPASPVAGTIYYDSTLNTLRCYDGTSWHNLF